MKIFEVATNFVRDVNRVQAYLDAGKIPNRLILRGLVAEAHKAGSFEQFQQDYIGQIKHGLYWHWTQNPNFQIDPNLGPRDMSTMGGGTMTPGKLMITSDLGFWSNYGEGGKARPFVAIIDMSAVPREAYRQVGRSFGNEFFVNDPSAARVTKVVTPQQAYRIDADQNSWLPQSFSQLQRFYELATGRHDENY